ncbi:DUF6281 family protein [Streptomyces kanamyceticus]|uniref:Uncharacterized protein n=1 Tax=Streptomyces kanamyceticus TaxID=1967 RepID=Q1EQK2_STRKN|nr:DUF6281 family protein [Streptomyces kanamyceticus]BAE95518.1 hypothetical protein [Streptomyces kanamyceticus]
MASPVQSRRIPTWASVVTVGAILTAGCAPQSDEGVSTPRRHQEEGAPAQKQGGGAAASCAKGVTFKGSSYWDLGRMEFTVGDKLGTARSIPCDDVDGVDVGENHGRDRHKSADPQSASYNVYRVKGIDTSIAIAIGQSPAESTLFSVHKENEGLPPEVQRLVNSA